MISKKGVTKAKVRINTILEGEPATWLRKWKNDGIVSSYTDAVLQGLRLLKDHQVQCELKSLQLENLKVLE